MPEQELTQLLSQAEAMTAFLCRRSFADFVKEFWSEVPGAGEVPDWNWHMDVICHELQKVAERVFRGLPKEYDLVCNISPGTSKSTLFSILFPAWTWARMPSCRHLSATHTDMLALDLASKSRSVVKSEKYRALFPAVVPRDDQDTKSYFANTKGGDRLTCTVGGKSPMGFHAHFITVDDPIDPKKVMSELELKAAKEFMTQVIPTRKVDKAVSVTFLVMQRLHEDDPSGVMLASHDELGGRKVRHICLPAELAENVSPPELRSYYVDGLMDPKRLGRPVLNEMKKTLSAYAYAGQFGQSPVPLGGSMFRDYYFNQRVKAAPYQAKRIRYWDRACLVAGTMIPTAQGPKSIERVKVGELVLTRSGYRPVTFSGETKRVRSVLSVLFHSGSIVTGTPDHPVWTENRGWVPLGELTKDDTALCCHETGMSWDDRSPVAWPVVSVPRTFDEDVPVYDLTVDGEHEFFANGILVHNSTEDGGCFTAGVLMAKDADGNFYVEHCVWGQWEPYERNQRMLATAIRDRSRYGPKYEPTVYVEAEGGSSGKDAMKGVVKALAGFHVMEDRVTGDKVTRANPWSAQLAAKNVYVVDDGCFPAGVMVSASEGPKPIESVMVGDLVMTRRGFRRVIWSGMTKRATRLASVEFDDGSVLTGTPEHRIWTENRGWVHLEDCHCDDNMVGESRPLQRESSWASAVLSRSQTPEPSSSRGSSTTFDPDPFTTSVGSGDFFTEPSGRIITVLSRTATRSTTRTRTNSTTASIIWSAFPRESTEGFTPSRIDSGSIWQESARWQRLGTELRTVAERVVRLARRIGRTASLLITSALSAVRHSCRTASSSSFAPSSVLRNTTTTLEPTGRRGSASSAESPVGPRTRTRRPVLVTALEYSDGVPVYDLTVEDAHEFFANGILVHNSWDLDNYVREHCLFPLGKYKDQVDASSGAFNLLTGMRADVSIRCMPIRPKGPKDALRLVVASEEAVRGIAVDEKSLLVRFQGLMGSEEPLKHGLVNLLDTLELRFEPVQPKDCQETWGQPVAPFGLPAIDLIMNREHGKKLWAFLTKKRDPPASAVVFVDDGDRALAAAYAVCDVLRPRLPTRPRPQVFQVGQRPEEQHDGEAENRHVYDTVRACRGLVVS